MTPVCEAVDIFLKFVSIHCGSKCNYRHFVLSAKMKVGIADLKDH